MFLLISGIPGSLILCRTSNWTESTIDEALYTFHTASLLYCCIIHSNLLSCKLFIIPMHLFLVPLYYMHDDIVNHDGLPGSLSPRGEHVLFHRVGCCRFRQER